jgi:hypothetical protein
MTAFRLSSIYFAMQQFFIFAVSIVAHDIIYFY